MENVELIIKVITPVLVVLAGVITAVMTNTTKLKLNTNSREFDDKINGITDKLEIMSKEMEKTSLILNEKKQNIDVLLEIGNVLTNSLIYSDKQKVSDYLSHITDIITDFADILLLRPTSSITDKYIVTSLRSCKMRIFNNIHFNIELSMLETIEEATKPDFLRYENDLIRLLNDKINNKKERFKNITVIFLQDVLSIVISATK